MKISVITVAYNSESTIQACINSVHEQTYSNVEHIIIDGNSTDNTLEIILSNKNRVSKIISEPDQGIYDAMNKGIKIATGDFVGMLNSDDKFYSNNSLEQMAEAFKTYNVNCVFGNMIYTNKYGEVVRKWISKPFKQGLFEKSWTPGHPTFYCKKELYDQYGYYKTVYQIAADVELMLRFLEVEKVKSHHINEFLVEMLEGGVSNEGLKSTITITKEMRRAFKENNLKLPLLKYIFYKALKFKEFI